MLQSGEKACCSLEHGGHSAALMGHRGLSIGTGRCQVQSGDKPWRELSLPTSFMGCPPEQGQSKNVISCRYWIPFPWQRVNLFETSSL